MIHFPGGVLVHALFTTVGRFSVRFRWLILVVWVVGTAAAVALLPSLSSVTQNDNTDFLPSGAPSTHASALAAPFQKANLTPIPVVVARSGGALTTADETAIAQMEAAIRNVPTVTTVRDLGRSPDGQAEQIQALATVTQNDQQAQKTLVTDLRAAIAHTSLPDGLTANLAGSVASKVDVSAQSGNSGNQVTNLSVIFIILVLLLIFRSLLAPLVTLAPALLVTELAGPLIAEATHAGVKVSGLAQLMLIVLVLGAGTDYGLFLVFRMREELRAGLEPKEAVVHAVARVGESITFSAGTVIAALLSLLAATFGIYSNLGVPLAIGIGLMLIAGLTLLPALLAIFGRAVFWPTKTRSAPPKIELWGRISGRIVRRPAVTLIAGLVMFGGLSFAVLGYTASGFGGNTSPPSGSDSAAGNTALSAHFPSASANPTQILFTLPQSVWTQPDQLSIAQQQLSANHKDFTTVTGPLNPNGNTLTATELTQLHSTLGPASTLPPVQPAMATVPPKLYQAYRGTAQYVSEDGHTVLFAVGLTAGDASGAPAMQAVPAIRAVADRVDALINATDHGVAGQAPALYDVSNTANHDLQTVVPIAIAIIAALLGLVMRSLVAPLYLIVSVGLSYLAALGLAVLVFITIGHSAGLNFILPFLMFLFLLALGEDYNILVMTRIREEAQRLPLREAVTTALAATGTTVTSAGLVLAGTFAVFAVAGGSSQIQQIGIGIAVGVLMDTFLVRTLLVPSTVVLLGRWNWWPSKLARKSEPELEEHRPVPVRLDGGGGDFATPISGHVRRSVGGTIGRTIMTLIDPSGRQVGRAVSGDDGRYQLADQPQASTVTVGSWPTVADVVLAGTSRLFGTVSAARTGTAIPGAIATLTDDRGEVVGSACTGADGRYVFSDLLAGQHTLVVRADAYRPVALAVSVPDSGDCTQDVEVAGGGRLHGAATAPDGRAVPDAQITLLDEAGSMVALTTTNEAGEYSLSDLPDGDYTLIAIGYPPVASTFTISGNRHGERDVQFGHPDLSPVPAQPGNLTTNQARPDQS
jgi:RND superfamily putative drug exporter